MERSSQIIRTSLIGIGANLFLAAFKAAIGVLSNSIAITMDAVNNLSDAMSSLITILGTKLAAKQPDRKHPLGYGRVEDLSATVISVIVLYAGVTSLIESVKKIIHPETADYAAVSLVIIAVAVLVKIGLGLYVQKMGKKTDSDALIASGKDAMFDAVISASTLAAALIYLCSEISLEAWLGAAISLLIVKSGVEMLRDTISKILGERVDKDLALGIKSAISAFPEVLGTYDLIIHNYGPNLQVGSVHIELPTDMTVAQLAALEYRIEAEVFDKYRVVLTGISVYAVDPDNPEGQKIHRDIRDIVESYPEIASMHGFYIDLKEKELRFDIVLRLGAGSRERQKEIYADIRRRVEERCPGYHIQINVDYDISD
ncbi:cation diffusion facilitator family transporter [Clostridium vitabionis]|uniref:cation diffusion facilitator family transporter n=1 Tax=Clostridium vitabionis TaxID=2784388 RepID=UPI00188BB7F9|nr:cation diffusion facilitator family transporter [Clostridium vitabionis]